MIAVVTVLLCVPLGWFVRSRLVANTTYAVVYLWAFTYQTLYLQLDAGTFPPGEFPLSYGLATAAVFAVGFGLIAAARAARAARSRHEARSETTSESTAEAVAGTG